MKDFSKLERNLGYKFKDKALLKEALTHKSSVKYMERASEKFTDLHLDVRDFGENGGDLRAKTEQKLQKNSRILDKNVKQNSQNNTKTPKNSRFSSDKNEQDLSEISPKILSKNPPQKLAKTLKTPKNSRFYHTNNERLEFLGDAVLDLIVGEFLFFKFAHHSEGELSKLRAALVNEKSFAKIALNLELGKYIFMSNAEENNDGRNKPSILSDALESVIAAIYLEAGFEQAKSVALSLLEANFPHIDEAHLIKDYKTKLQEYTQATLAQAPEYETLRAFGPDHKKCFEVALKLDGKEFARATANSKKEAQQMAAKITLERLNFG